MALDLAALSHDDLYELATRLQIKRRSKMTEDELREACRVALAEKGEPEALDPEAQALAEAEEEAAATPEPEPVLSVENHRKIRGAQREQLEMILADQEIPPYLRRAVEAELQERDALEDRKRQEIAAQGPMVRYLVTKGGRYCSKDGFITHLPEGSMVTPLTHDLKHVASQGIEWKEVTTMRTTHGQLGEQVSKAET